MNILISEGTSFYRNKFNNEGIFQLIADKKTEWYQLCITLISDFFNKLAQNQPPIGRTRFTALLTASLLKS